LTAAIKWLKDQPSKAQVICWDPALRDVIWAQAGDLIFPGRFRQVHCPACGRDYKPSEGKVEEWAVEEDEEQAAEGGRRFLCPRGHTLYGIWEWMD
jgi:hypothetical protein